MDLSMDEYCLKYMGRRDLQVVRVWDADEEVLIYYDMFDLPEEHRNKVVTFPIGKVDKTGALIFQGDILKVTIHMKYGDIDRIAAVRTDGFYCCGLDYFNKEGYITEEGDYVDEFFIEEMEIIGNVFTGYTLEDT